MAESSTKAKPTGHEAAAADTLAAVTHESGEDVEGPPATSDGEADVLAVGATVGRYLVVERLGAGAMGVVYAAYDPKLDRKVALKLLRPRAGGDPARRTARLEREAQGLAKLSHPNVVGIFDVGVHDGQVFLAMEFLGGGTLRAWLESLPRRSWREILAVFVAVGRGLAAAHSEGLIHRDFKPDNVLLDKAGNPKVVDFGLVRLMGERTDGDDSDGHEAGRDPAAPSGLTRTGAMTGTPAYMAAEQFLGRPVDARTDQFAFCVSLYEALLGERPFAGQTVLQLADAVTTNKLRDAPREAAAPAWLRKVVARGLGSNPDTRWPSMAALIEALGDDPAVRARRRWVSGAIVAVVAATLLGARHMVRLRHGETEREIARNREESGRQVEAARAKAAAARALRTRAFAAFDAMDRDSGEALWRQGRALVGDIDAGYDRAAAYLDAALTLDPTRADLRGDLADLHLQHIMFAEDVRLDSKAQALMQRLAAVDGDGTRRKTLAAEGTLEVKTRPAGSDSKIVLEHYERDATSGRRLPKRLAAMDGPTSVSSLPPGSYRLSFEGESRARVSYPVEVHRGERVSLDVWLPPETAVPQGFVYVPPGPFWFGDGDEKLRTQFLDTVPLHRRQTGGYLIARQETTYGEWIVFLNALGAAERERHTPRISSITRGSLQLSRSGEGSWKLEFQPTGVRHAARAGGEIVYPGRTRNARQDWLKFPVAGVSAEEAERYLAWLRETGRVPGARLCSELEWERAARGADDRVFPHGDELLADDANIDATYGRVDSAYGPDMVGLHPSSRSPFELDDMAGNLLELVSSSQRPGEIVMRGGAYFFNSITARATNRNAVSKSFRDVTTGIRVCASIEGDK